MGTVRLIIAFLVSVGVNTYAEADHYGRLIQDGNNLLWESQHCHGRLDISETSNITPETIAFLKQITAHPIEAVTDGNCITDEVFNMNILRLSEDQSLTIRPAGLFGDSIMIYPKSVQIIAKIKGQNKNLFNPMVRVPIRPHKNMPYFIGLEGTIVHQGALAAYLDDIPNHDQIPFFIQGAFSEARSIHVNLIAPWRDKNHPEPITPALIEGILLHATQRQYLVNLVPQKIPLAIPLIAEGEDASELISGKINQGPMVVHAHYSHEERRIILSKDDLVTPSEQVSCEATLLGSLFGRRQQKKME